MQLISFHLFFPSQLKHQSTSIEIVLTYLVFHKNVTVDSQITNTTRMCCTSAWVVQIHTDKVHHSKQVCKYANQTTTQQHCFVLTHVEPFWTPSQVNLQSCSTMHWRTELQTKVTGSCKVTTTCSKVYTIPWCSSCLDCAAVTALYS